jgi:dUTP pyrophosphatase
MLLTYKKISETAKAPIRAYPTDSGLDVFSDETVAINPRDIKLVSTGIAFQIPKIMQSQLGFTIVPELQVRPKSGLALKGLTVLNSPGTIDNSFNGHLKVIVHNVTTKSQTIQKGQKIAQVVMSYVLIPEIREVEEFSSLETTRGNSGFGSTGNY